MRKRVVQRFDRVRPLGTETGARVDKDTGFLHAPIHPTRTGVLLYRLKDGSISRELKHPEDVFGEASLESLKRLVITRGHPTDDVSAKNVRRLQIGHLGDEITRERIGDEEHIRVGATITDAKAVKDITGPTHEDENFGWGDTDVSAGYTTLITDESGVYNGEPYDRRHTQIRYNHLAAALSPGDGRAGTTVSVKLDAVDGVEVRDKDNTGGDPPEPPKETPMYELTIDGIVVKLEDAGVVGIVSQAIRDRDNTIKKQDDRLKEQNEQIGAEKKRADEAEAKATKAEDAAKKRDSKVEPGSLRDTLDVLEGAATVLGDAWTRKGKDGKSVRDAVLDDGHGVAEIRKAVVLAARKDDAEALADKSDDYFEAVFDDLVKSASRKDSTAEAGKSLLDMRSAPPPKDDIQARLDDVLSIADPLMAHDLP